MWRATALKSLLISMGTAIAINDHADIIKGLRVLMGTAAA